MLEMCRSVTATLFFWRKAVFWKIFKNKSFEVKIGWKKEVLFYKSGTAEQINWERARMLEQNLVMVICTFKITNYSKQFMFSKRFQYIL